MLTRSLLIVVPVSLLCNAAGWQAHANSVDPRSWANFLSPVTGRSPRSEQLIKNGVDISKRTNQGKATRIRKMSSNESEMFLPHFWTFERVYDDVGERKDMVKRDPTAFLDALKSPVHSPEDWSNASVLYPLQAPFALHGEQQTRKDLTFGASGGGCCLPGFQCYGIGCAKGSTTTVVIDPTVTALPTTTSTSKFSTTSIIPTRSTTPTVVPAPVPTTTSTTSSPTITFTSPSTVLSPSLRTSPASSSDTLNAPVSIHALPITMQVAAAMGVIVRYQTAQLQLRQQW
ncbi:MAG: hypothetical protein Q9191_000987 [Dirinaria sp. TL-2023a]